MNKEIPPVGLDSWLAMNQKELESLNDYFGDFDNWYFNDLEKIFDRQPIVYLFMISRGKHNET